MAIRVGRTEAERLQLNGYGLENRGDASGGQAIRVSGASTGTASDTFSGQSGNYRLTVNYLDENDGVSSYQLLVNGQVVDSWSGTGGGSGIGTLASRDIDLSLSDGDTIAIRGTVGGQEFARVDSLDLAFTGSSGPSGATLGIGTTEAEALDLAGGYFVQSSSVATNGQVIGTATQGTASGTFTGAAGDYDITVNYLDESDGVATYRLLVNGSIVNTWQGDGGTSPSGTLTAETTTVSLSNGDTIALEGVRADGEAARIDTVEIAASSGGGSPPPPPPPPPSTDATIGLGTTQAEALDLSGGFEIETGRSGAGDDTLIRTFNGPAEASGVFTGQDGRYEFDITYFNEADGVATFAVEVNGQTVETWQGTGGTGGGGVAATRTFTANLDTGDTITLVGTRGGGELARFDQIALSSAGGAQIGLGTTQAEALDLSGGYEIENGRSGAGDNTLIRTFGGPSEASGIFAGPDGTYDLDVTFFNEADGVATFAVQVNGLTVSAWQGTGGNGGGGSPDTRSITLDLDTGDTISLVGTKNDGELARFDQIELTNASGGGSPPPPLAEIGLGITQAEALDLSGGFEIETGRSTAAGNALIRTFGGPAEASGTFTGADGAYDLDVTFFNEQDGVATFAVEVNGQIVETWQGTGGTGGGGVPEIESLSLDLETGDVITLVGTRQDGELARFDQIELTATSGGGSPPPPPPPPPNTGLPDITVGTTEAEDLNRSGYDIENRGSASGGQLVRTSGTGTITGEFQGDPGTYRLTINYFDESDGVASYTVRVNGQVRSTFSGTGGRDPAGDPASKTITLGLNPGDQITVEGVRGGEELARIDSLALASSTGGGSGGTLSFAGDNTAYTVDLAANSYAEAAKILLLGDSLTDGAAIDGGYRAPLWDAITEDLGLWVDFVGSRTANPAEGLPDSDHQGVGGITSSTVRGQINSIVNANPNDFVLLMLGTNDALQFSNPQNTVRGNLLTIMQRLEQANPDVKILLGTLPPTNRPEAAGEIPAINATLPGLVTQANNLGIDATLVSFANISTNDYYDTLHPDAQGVVKFAGNWLGGLTSVASQTAGTFDGEAIAIASSVSNVTGGNNNDRLLGDGDANRLNGSGGNDWLDGRGGNDTLSGGSGTDLFAFDANQDGTNTITDFAGGETIRLTGFGFTNTSQAANAFFQQGSNVVFNRSGVSITIQNANVAQVRSNVEIGASPNYAPEVGEDSFAFDAFTGGETIARIEAVEEAASTPVSDAPMVLESGDGALVFDLFDEIDPDSGLYY